jgi:uncharacterized protein YndB with AHSA1/START domain
MIEVTHQIEDVERRVGTRMLEAGEARTVTISQTYATDIEDLWDACTNPDRIPRWFLPISGDLRVGGRYALEGNASGVVETCDPPNRFTATWEFGGEVSWIEVRFTSDLDGGTRLQLEHIAHVDDERWAEFGPGAVGVGWDLALLGLALHVRTGAGLDHDEVEAWTASADGRDFMTRSSDGWCRASVAAGTPEPAAEAAARRTTAAYSGKPPA